MVVSSLGPLQRPTRWRLAISRLWSAIGVLGCLGLLLATSGATNPRAAWIAQGRGPGLSDGLLRTGVDASYPPFAASAVDGELWGLEVDLAQELAARLGVETNVSNTDVGNGLDALVADRYDVLLAGLSSSPDIADRASFSRPYFDDGPRLIALGATPGRELVGKRIGLELGSLADQSIRRLIRQGVPLAVSRYPDPDSVLEGLRGGQVDVALLDGTTALLAVAVDSELFVRPEPLESRPLSIAIRRANRSLSMILSILPIR